MAFKILRLCRIMLLLFWMYIPKLVIVPGPYIIMSVTYFSHKTDVRWIVVLGSRRIDVWGLMFVRSAS